MKLLNKLLNKSTKVNDAALFVSEHIKSELRRHARYDAGLVQFKHMLSTEFGTDFDNKELSIILREASDHVYSSGIRILCDSKGIVASRPLSLEIKGV